MTATEPEDFWNQPIDWEAYREVAFVLVDDRGGDEYATEDTRPRDTAKTPA